MGQFSVSIGQIVDLLGLERSPRSYNGSSSFNVKCPFCTGGDKKHHLNINLDKDVYNCFACSANGGALDLYSRVRFGERVDSNNRKRMFVELMKDLGNDIQPNTTAYKEQAQSYTILPADDEVLDRVYSSLLKLPYLKLSEAHRMNLIQRGLLESDIRQNGYATMPDDKSCRIDGLDYWSDLYRQENIEEERSGNGLLKYTTVKSLILGMKIADDLLKANVTLDNVPGFFKLKGHWCLKVDAGILIPTRNGKHQIVGIQTRRDVKTKSGLRYMTLSSKGLPCGVTDHIARTHFPLGNAKIDGYSSVIITEGPLKADTALSLLKQLHEPDVAFIALQGVAATRELPQIAKALKASGVDTVINGFDMDKLVNVNVMEALYKVGKLLKAEQLEMRVLCWGTDYIKRKLTQMRRLMLANDLEIPKYDSISQTFYAMSRTMKEKDIEFAFIYDDEGNIVFENWDATEKGIDDHLLKILRGIGE